MRFLQDILGNFYSGFRFSVTMAVARRGLYKVEVVILGETRGCRIDAVIRDAMTGKILFHNLYNGTGCCTS